MDMGSFGMSMCQLVEWIRFVYDTIPVEHQNFSDISGYQKGVLKLKDAGDFCVA